MRYNGWSIFFGVCTLSGLGIVVERGIEYIGPACIASGVYGLCLILNLRHLNDPEYIENKKIKEKLK